MDHAIYRKEFLKTLSFSLIEPYATARAADPHILRQLRERIAEIFEEAEAPSTSQAAN